MYRCVTELKGLLIDIDSFADVALPEWNRLCSRYQCLFITSDDEKAKALCSEYAENTVLLLSKFAKVFAPNSDTHIQSLKKIGLCTTEVAYVSRNIGFLDKAMGFLCGSIWVAAKVTYREASIEPDLVCHGFEALCQLLESNVKGFLGEVAAYPGEEKKGAYCAGSI